MRTRSVNCVPASVTPAQPSVPGLKMTTANAVPRRVGNVPTSAGPWWPSNRLDEWHRAYGGDLAVAPFFSARGKRVLGAPVPRNMAGNVV